MKDKKMKIGIEEIKKITMTASEKEQVLNSILNSSHNLKPVKSPWSFYSFMFIANKTKLVYYIIVPLILILSGGGVVFASTDSLPDNILYPIKVKIVEPIEGALTLSKKSKAKYQSSLAERRLVEAEILANEGKLAGKNEKKISNLLSKHTEDLNNTITNANENDIEDIDTIVTDFRAQMSAHAKVLDSLAGKGKESDDIKENQNIKISNTARVGADKIKNLAIEKEIDKVKKFKEKKEEVKLIVDNTDQEISTNLSEDNLSDKNIKDDTHKTIDQAKAYLYDALKNDEDGDIKKAYSSLLDSESSAKEAKILLKAGLKAKENKDKNDHNNKDD